MRDPSRPGGFSPLRPSRITQAVSADTPAEPAHDDAGTSLRLRPLEARDIPFAMSLKDAERWNQTDADWSEFLSLRPDGCFLAEWDGEPAGTVTTIVHGGAVGWIGMLLVQPSFRRRGVATALLRRAMESLEGCSVLLDATPAGREVYLQLGFRDEARLERRVRPATSSVRPAVAESLGPALAGHRVRPGTPADLDLVEPLDAAAFGACRRPLLESWLRRAPRLAFVAEAAGGLSGYVLGRHGSRGDHVGPLAAVSREAAYALLDRAARAAAGRPVLLDVFTEDAAWCGHVESEGFIVERPFIRMRRGDGPSAPRAAGWKLYASAGPEVG